MDHQEGAKKVPRKMHLLQTILKCSSILKPKALLTKAHDNDFEKLLGPLCMKQKPLPKSHKTSMSESS
jgi:hypothetical protein